MKKLPFRFIFSTLFLALPISSHALDQWASSVISFSSQFSTTSWSAKQALKASNVNAYGDNSLAWTTSTQDAGEEFITLGYKTPVYATGVTIRETYGNGFVTRVDAIDTANVPHKVWSGTDTSAPGQINDFLVSWPSTPYLVKAVKITLNTALQSSWEEIDSVKLHGIEPLSGSIAPRLEHTAKLECTNVTTSKKVSATIKGRGQTAPVSQWDCEKAGLKFSVGDTVSIQITGNIAP
ncbi:MAG: hypothetical protein PHR16_06705 [Methylovulum sp.]|nr:hypothetical protein [Methylovulum sp.]